VLKIQKDINFSFRLSLIKAEDSYVLSENNYTLPWECFHIRNCFDKFSKRRITRVKGMFGRAQVKEKLFV